MFGLNLVFVFLLLQFLFSLLQANKARRAGAAVYAIGIGAYVEKDVCRCYGIYVVP